MIHTDSECVCRVEDLAKHIWQSENCVDLPDNQADCVGWDCLEQAKTRLMDDDEDWGKS
jgi:hypothetical protein